MKNLDSLLADQLRDIYSAEEQLTEVLPEMAKRAGYDKLKNAFKEHLSETCVHKERLEKICALLDINPYGDKCLAIREIVKEVEIFMADNTNADIMDVGIIANAHRIEHYAIAAYSTIMAYAARLGYDKVIDLLNETIQEEKNMDKTLTELSIEAIKEDALS